MLHSAATMSRATVRTLLLAALALVAARASVQSPDGAAVFTHSCAGCHTGAADSRAPATI